LKRSLIYSNANFCHFQELLKEYEKITISYSALYTLLKKAGITSPKKRRRFPSHRRRKRKEQEGLPIQLDASSFSWLSDNRVYHLHGGIDDATGQVVGLYLTESECLEGYFQTMYLMLELFGIPISTYSDRHTIFFSPKCDKLSLEEELAGKRGKFDPIWTGYAHFAPEAKEKSAFRPIPKGMNIDHILCVIEKRIYDRGGVFSFYHKHCQIIEDKDLPPLWA